MSGVTPVFFFKQPDKMVGILDAYHLADFHNLFICFKKQLLCLVNAYLVEVLYRCIFIILCKFAAQAELVDTVFQRKLVEGVRFFI